MLILLLIDVTVKSGQLKKIYIQEKKQQLRSSGAVLWCLCNKPDIGLASFFMGHLYRQTVLTQIRHLIMRIMQCLIRIITVCLQNIPFKFWGKDEIPANTPKIGNGLILLIKGRQVYLA